MKFHFDCDYVDSFTGEEGHSYHLVCNLDGYSDNSYFGGEWKEGQELVPCEGAEITSGYLTSNTVGCYLQFPLTGNQNSNEPSTSLEYAPSCDMLIYTEDNTADYIYPVANFNYTNTDK